MKFRLIASGLIILSIAAVAYFAQSGSTSSSPGRSDGNDGITLH